MNAGFDHFPESIWEAYSMDALSEEDCAAVEEHLLICPACQELLADTDEYVRVARAALRRTRNLKKKAPGVAPLPVPAL